MRALKRVHMYTFSPQWPDFQAPDWHRGWAERERCLSPLCQTPASTCRPWSAPHPTLWWPTSITPGPAPMPVALMGTSQLGLSGTERPTVMFGCRSFTRKSDHCHVQILIPISLFLYNLISPSFTFPHPITPVAYQQLLSQHRGLSAFGHTPPLIQPSPSFINRQQPIGTATAHSTSCSNPSTDTSQVSKLKRKQ